MGVMACHRAGCDEILCDHLSDTYGYLCSGCLRELIHIAIEKKAATPGDLHKVIERFMRSKKPPFEQVAETADLIRGLIHHEFQVDE